MKTMRLIDYARKLNALIWDWKDQSSVRDNLTQLGFTLLQEYDENEIWQNAKGMLAEVRLQDESRLSQITLILHSEDVENLDETQFTQLEEQMEADYEQAVSDLTQVLGQADEVGTVSGSQYMSEQFADLGACWLGENHQMMLLFGQQDTELPLQLMLVISAKSTD